MYIRIPRNADVVIKTAARILARELRERGEIATDSGARAPAEGRRIELRVSDKLPAESFQLVKKNDDRMEIVGGDSRGVLYGCGRCLRTCRFSKNNVVFGESESLSVPEKSVRGMYFASHSRNFYEVAPREEITRYIEELALWGINCLGFLFHMFFLKGMNDPKAQATIRQLNIMMEAAHAAGMDTALLVCPNDGYLTSPEGLRYVGNVPRNCGTEICPSRPAGMRFIQAQMAELFDQFDRLDVLVLWPYDHGGCLCEQCRPWGANGFYKVSEEVQRIFRARHPGGRVVLSAWYFDYNCGAHGEWDALYERLEKDLDWVDMVMADGASVSGDFPRQVIERKMPRPVISFAEISMRSGSPWGGFGANPLPAFFEQQWAICGKIIDGGLPYSEGIYEDVNKVIWSQLCWKGDRTPRDIMQEYAAYEFSPAGAEEIVHAMALMETTGMHAAHLKRFALCAKNLDHAEEVWETISFLERALPERARQSWRWRMVFLRARIDAELKRTAYSPPPELNHAFPVWSKPTPELGRAYDELARIQRVDDGTLCYVRPFRVFVNGDPKNRELGVVQDGKGILAFCDRRKNADDVVV